MSSSTDPGTVGSEIILGGPLDNLLNADSLGGQDTIFGELGADTIVADGGDLAFGEGGDDLIILQASDGNFLDGGDDNDTLAFGFSGSVTVADGGTTLFFDDGNGTYSGSASNIESMVVSDGGGGFQTVALADGSYTVDATAVCFAEGTRILTALGEVAVEDLRGGDLVATIAGEGPPMKPVLWVGRRHVVLAGNPAAADLAPIRVKAGALADGVPTRDLLVSPDHCLFLDGVLVPAWLLVNGTSVVQEPGRAEIRYYHVELETHDVLLAEGAAAETWLDCGNRSWFANAPVARLKVDGTLDAQGTGWNAGRACAPVIEGGARLGAIRAAIEARAAPATRPAALIRAA
jgi:hypothetical protein